MESYGANGNLCTVLKYGKVVRDGQHDDCLVRLMAHGTEDFHASLRDDADCRCSDVMQALRWQFVKEHIPADR